MDRKHGLIVDYDVVTEANDLNRLYRMARPSKSALSAAILTALASHMCRCGGFDVGAIAGDRKDADRSHLGTRDRNGGGNVPSVG